MQCGEQGEGPERAGVRRELDPVGAAERQLVQAGQAALQNGNASQALDLGRQVLVLMPNEPRATALVAQAQAAVDAAAKKKPKTSAAQIRVQKGVFTGILLMVMHLT